jgi:hypothetical protein
MPFWFVRITLPVLPVAVLVGLFEEPTELVIRGLVGVEADGPDRDGTRTLSDKGTPVDLESVTRDQSEFGSPESSPQISSQSSSSRM